MGGRVGIVAAVAAAAAAADDADGDGDEAGFIRGGVLEGDR